MAILFQIILLLIITNSCCFADIEIFSAGKRFESFADYQKGVGNIQTKEENQLIPYFSTVDQGKLDKMSFNKGFEDSLLDFNHDWNSIRFIDMVDSGELPKTLKQVIGKNREPALLISEAGRLRIMSLKK